MVDLQPVCPICWKLFFETLVSDFQSSINLGFKNHLDRSIHCAWNHRFKIYYDVEYCNLQSSNTIIIFFFFQYCSWQWKHRNFSLYYVVLSSSISFQNFSRQRTRNDLLLNMQSFFKTNSGFIYIYIYMKSS